MSATGLAKAVTLATDSTLSKAKFSCRSQARRKRVMSKIQQQGCEVSPGRSLGLALSSKPVSGLDRNIPGSTGCVTAVSVAIRTPHRRLDILRQKVGELRPLLVPSYHRPSTAAAIPLWPKWGRALISTAGFSPVCDEAGGDSKTFNGLPPAGRFDNAFSSYRLDPVVEGQQLYAQ